MSPVSLLLVVAGLFVFGIVVVGVGAFGAGVVYGAKKLNEINDASILRRMNAESEAYERRGKFETQEYVTREMATTGEQQKRLEASIEYQRQVAELSTGKIVNFPKPS